MVYTFDDPKIIKRGTKIPLKKKSEPGISKNEGLNGPGS